MIFVTVGSTDFDTLVQAVDALCDAGGPLAGHEVVMQIGEGRYEPRHGTFFRFAPALRPYYEAADLVIAHGGLGTAVEAMGCGCRLVAVTNPDRYDHHQDDLIGTLAEQGCLRWCSDLASLGDVVRDALSFCPQPYECPPCTIHEVIAGYVERNVTRKRLS